MFAIPPVIVAVVATAFACRKFHAYLEDQMIDAHIEKSAERSHRSWRDGYKSGYNNCERAHGYCHPYKTDFFSE